MLQLIENNRISVLLTNFSYPAFFRGIVKVDITVIILITKENITI